MDINNNLFAQPEGYAQLGGEDVVVKHTDPTNDDVQKEYNTQAPVPPKISQFRLVSGLDRLIEYNQNIQNHAIDKWVIPKNIDYEKLQEVTSIRNYKERIKQQPRTDFNLEEGSDVSEEEPVTAETESILNEKDRDANKEEPVTAETESTLSAEDFVDIAAQPNRRTWSEYFSSFISRTPPKTETANLDITITDLADTLDTDTTDNDVQEEHSTQASPVPTKIGRSKYLPHLTTDSPNLKYSAELITIDSIRKAKHANESSNELSALEKEVNQRQEERELQEKKNGLQNLIEEGFVIVEEETTGPNTNNQDLLKDGFVIVDNKN
jgi:hypothetical protein